MQHLTTSLKPHSQWMFLQGKHDHATCNPSMHGFRCAFSCRTMCPHCLLEKWTGLRTVAKCVQYNVGIATLLGLSINILSRSTGNLPPPVYLHGQNLKKVTVEFTRIWGLIYRGLTCFGISKMGWMMLNGWCWDLNNIEQLYSPDIHFAFSSTPSPARYFNRCSCKTYLLNESYLKTPVNYI